MSILLFSHILVGILSFYFVIRAVSNIVQSRTEKYTRYIKILTALLLFEVVSGIGISFLTQSSVATTCAKVGFYCVSLGTVITTLAIKQREFVISSSSK